ncbi:hypothetical protein C2857_007749 [Epichloe festucae Fl1]|uniref:Uncharacterized protein n=1 Tax=Epichloe festucae (strain Fl1) TaxID=877507 RepID=A0A7S9PTA2_EPIFF|nr:hypothetical protein C2857_007749 [Epichloe festucae Fl1]
MISQAGCPPARAAARSLEDDVSTESGCVFVFTTALSYWGRVDILIDGVGILEPKGDVVGVNVADWARGLEINVTTMMLMSKYAVPAMLENELADEDGAIRGIIVNIESIAGLQGGAPSLLYPTSNGAVVNMTRAMAAHHGRDGIRVNRVCPGMNVAFRSTVRPLSFLFETTLYCLFFFVNLFVNFSGWTFDFCGDSGTKEMARLCHDRHAFHPYNAGAGMLDEMREARKLMPA